MADVVYQDPIEHLSGKISKKYRTCYNYRKTSKRKYTSVHGDRAVPYNETEVAIHNQFRVVRAAVQARVTNLSYVVQDQRAFKEMRANGGKWTTYRGWLFAKAWDNYNPETNQVVWPASLG